MKPAAPTFVLYTGMSMWPGFEDGDLLEVVPVAMGGLRRGDVIVFHYEGGLRIVHRVVSAGPAVRTRGDALTTDDCFFIDEKRLIGKVVRRYRLGAETTVHGGWRGRLLGRGYHLASRLNPGRPSRGGRLARHLRGAAIRVAGRLRMRGEIREVSLAGRPPVTICYWGRRAIGRWDAASGNWSVFWPWCLLWLPAETERRTSTPTDAGTG